MINSEDNHVNNLDLNADGDIDYIKVIDKSDGDVHAFVLQVIVSETENQDIAVIEMEKTEKNRSPYKLSVMKTSMANKPLWSQLKIK